MKSLILALSLLAPLAHAEDAEQLKVTGVGFGCDLGASIQLITQDKMGQVRRSPNMDYDQNTGQLMAIDRDGTSFPIGNLPLRSWQRYRATCDQGGNRIPDWVQVELMPDLKVYLLKEQATAPGSDYTNCGGDFLVPWYARHCTTTRAIPHNYVKDTFVFVRQGQRVDREGDGYGTLLQQ